MAANSVTFETLGVSAARAASTMPAQPNARSSFYTKQGPSRVERFQTSVKKGTGSFLRGVKKLFGKDASKSSFRHKATYEALTGEAAPSHDPNPTITLTQPSQKSKRETVYRVHQGPATPVAEAFTKNEKARKSVLIHHPEVKAVHDAPVPTTAKTWSSDATTDPVNANRFSTTSTLPSEPDYFAKNVYDRARASALVEGVMMTPNTFSRKLDGHPKANLEPSRWSQVPPQAPGSQGVPSLPPVLPEIETNGSRVSGFSVYKAGTPWPAPRLDTTDVPKLDSIDESPISTIQQNRNATLDALSVPAAPQHSIHRKPVPRKPVYRSSGAPPANDGRVYIAHNPEFGQPLDFSDNAEYSVDSNGQGRRAADSAVFVYDQAYNDIPATPAFSVSESEHAAANKRRTMIESGMISPMPPRPTNPEPPASPDSNHTDYLNNVYANAPTPPPQPEASTNKPLPPSPAPDSHLRTTPRPSANAQFPPRTDSRYPPPARSSGASRAPTPKQMIDNGYPKLDAQAANRYSAQPEYRKRGPLNEMSTKRRDHEAKKAAAYVKQAEEDRARTEALMEIQRNRKRTGEKMREGVEKLCNLQ